MLTEDQCSIYFLPFQALTYRVGHHSTSDDSTKYRPANEIEWWKSARDPVARFRKWIERNGWWNDMAESELRSSLRQQVNHLSSENLLVDARHHFVILANTRSSLTITIATAMGYLITRLIVTQNIAIL